VSQPDLIWTRPEWLAEAVEWIRERVEVTGEIEQPHVRWWSTVLRVPTADGDVWFKASTPINAFEPALTAELARVRPELITELVDADDERGWMLTRDAGVRLRELMGSAEDLVRWEEALPLYAELQLAVAPQAERLLEIGVPDERLAGFAGRFELLLANREAVMLGHEDGITEEEYARLHASVLEVARLSGELAAYGIPETIQHDDLHDGNVFVRDGRYVFFDWGDSCVTHPFHTLVVTLRAIAYRHGLEPGSPVLLRLRDAYLEPFSGFGRHSELVTASDLALRVGTIGRAHAWHRSLQSIEPELRSEEADSVPYGLKLFLQNGPIGTWQ
jgi:Phosphotransferase enzyme family